MNVLMYLYYAVNVICSSVNGLGWKMRGMASPVYEETICV